MIARIPPQLRQRAEAYRDGVNAWSAKVRSDPTLLPGEFAALGATPPTWTLRDTARVGVFLARTVPSSDGREIENARACGSWAPAGFDKLLPLRTDGSVPTVPGIQRHCSRPSRGAPASRSGRRTRARSGGSRASRCREPQAASGIGGGGHRVRRDPPWRVLHVGHRPPGEEGAYLQAP